ncbi:homoserine dehydrogenase [Chloroflexota bacterium]
MERRTIGIGLMGLGTIGGQVAAVLTERAKQLSAQAGCDLVLRKIRVLPEDLNRPVAQQFPAELFTTGDDFFTEPGIDIIIELIGGEEPAYRYQRQVLESGRHVVTANKEVIAKHGPGLLKIAAAQGVGLYYEASVGGGIPLIAPFKYDLVANNISGIYAIINGTTNYILTCMARDGMDFAEALARAQGRGYAEADPANDIEGTDAAYKMAILASLAFQMPVDPEQVYREGIASLGPQDFRYAAELGFAIKLLAITKRCDNAVEIRVHPVLLPEEAFLAKVEGVYNAVQVETDLAGKVLFFGQGAGALPTSSAVVADVLAAARRILAGGEPPQAPGTPAARRILPMPEITTRYYLRLTIADQPGVLGQIAQVLGENAISISAAIQKEADETEQSAEIVLMTHPATEAAFGQARTKLEQLDAVREMSNFIRVEDIE